MSDISIPGVTSRLQTDKMIEKLMELERVPLERMEGDLGRMEDQKDVWRDLSRKLTNLRNSAKTLYGFDSPFQNRVGTSADESVFTATATREAAFESSNIQVVQTAAADRFLSSSLPSDYRVPEGRYTFSVGDEEVSFQYNGGKLSDFAATVTRRGKDLLRAQVVRDTSDSYVLLVESLVTGAGNRLSFSEDAEAFALESGILKEMRSEDRDVTHSIDRLQRWSVPLDTNLFSLEGEALTAKPKAEALIPFRPIAESGSLVMEIDYRFIELGGDEESVPSPPPGPDIPPGGSISFQDITIDSASSRISLPEWTPPPKSVRIDDSQVLFLKNGNTVIPVQTPQTSGTLRIKLSDYADAVDGLYIRNRNTHKLVEIGTVRIFDPSVRGGYTPGNPVSEARDSVMKFQGIEVTRDNNTIDDLIPGVTLELHGTSEKQVKLDIEPDRESIKEEIITFVGYYNQLLGTVQILTSSDESVIDELGYYTDDEREDARDQLGLFQGDTTLMQMKSRLQTIMMNPYQTSAGRELSLLSQIGISTNSGGFGGSIDTTKLRGYLEIDEKTLDNVLKSNLTAVEDLFGRDTDQDLIVDAGAAYAADAYIKPYVETGGLISYRLSSLDTRIDRMERDIASYEEKLADKEQELRRKYTTMEGAVDSLQSSSQAIENLNNSLSGQD